MDVPDEYRIRINTTSWKKTHTTYSGYDKEDIVKALSRNIKKGNENRVIILGIELFLSGYAKDFWLLFWKEYITHFSTKSLNVLLFLINKYDLCNHILKKSYADAVNNGEFRNLIVTLLSLTPRFKYIPPETIINTINEPDVSIRSPHVIKLIDAYLIDYPEIHKWRNLFIELFGDIADKKVPRREIINRLCHLPALKNPYAPRAKFKVLKKQQSDATLIVFDIVIMSTQNSPNYQQMIGFQKLYTILVGLGAELRLRVDLVYQMLVFMIQNKTAIDQDLIGSPIDIYSPEVIQNVLKSNILFADVINQIPKIIHKPSVRLI